jgi:hypothetical protein
MCNARLLFTQSFYFFTPSTEYYMFTPYDGNSADQNRTVPVKSLKTQKYHSTIAPTAPTAPTATTTGLDRFTSRKLNV